MSALPFFSIHSYDSSSSSSSTSVNKVSELPKNQINHWSLSIRGKYKSKLQPLSVKWSNVQVLVLIQIRDLNHSFLFTCTFLYTKKTSSLSCVPFLCSILMFSPTNLVNNWYKDRLIPGKADTYTPAQINQQPSRQSTSWVTGGWDSAEQTECKHKAGSSSSQSGFIITI